MNRLEARFQKTRENLHETLKTTANVEKHVYYANTTAAHKFEPVMMCDELPPMDPVDICHNKDSLRQHDGCTATIVLVETTCTRAPPQ